jgi:hypothetical protein
MTDLSRNRYLSKVLHSRWTIFPVRVVKDDGDRGLRDTGLPTFVDKILLILRTHLKMGDLMRGDMPQRPWRTLTDDMLVRPRTKQIASRDVLAFQNR